MTIPVVKICITNNSAVSYKNIHVLEQTEVCKSLRCMPNVT